MTLKPINPLSTKSKVNYLTRYALSSLVILTRKTLKDSFLRSMALAATVSNTM